MQIFHDTNYDFIKYRWHAIALSWTVIVLGFILIVRGGLPLGIDFAGGTAVVVRFQQATSDEVVRKALDVLPGDKIVQAYGAVEQNQVMVRLPQQKTKEQGTNLEVGSRQVVDALQKGNLGKFEVVSTEIVGPTVGADLRQKGLYAGVGALIGILAYIAFRFRFSFAVGAVIATLHDAFITFAFLAFFGYELSLNVIAALLTITGYSVNDTIVIFDRVRENMRLLRKESLYDVVNRSVNQTLGRTVITAGTTFLSVLSLYLFGGEVLRGFAFTMLVGIVWGTYSSVFIAASIAILLERRRAGGSRTVAAPAPEPRRSAARKRDSRVS